MSTRILSVLISRELPRIVILLCALTLIEPGVAEETNSGVPTAEAILARIHAPMFPARDFLIGDFGAVPGGADNTESLKKAITACHDAGGGRVVVSPGVFHTGAIRLQSNVNLFLADGATLKFLPDSVNYLPVVLTRYEGIECMNYSPLIYALDQKNIAVTGKGTLDGSASGENWWGWCHKQTGQPARQSADRKNLGEMGEKGLPVEQRVFGEGHYLRPNFIQPYRCENVLIEGVTIIASPMWEVHPVLCTNVTVRGINIQSLGPNNDGCDPESCRDILIEDCVFQTGDDCIAIKSGRNNDGRRVGVASENIVVRRCTMKDGHGGVTIGSEISGGCRNVFVEDCQMDSHDLARAIRFKSNAQRGGVIENIFVRGIQIGQVDKAVLSVEFDYEEGAKGPYKPVLRNVQLENVSSQSSPRVLSIVGFPGAVIEGVRLTDCVFRGVVMENSIRDAAPPVMRNVVIEPLVNDKK